MPFFEDRRMLLRAILMMIIVGAIPLYLVGFLLLASSDGAPDEPTTQPTASFTPLGAGNTDTPTPTLTPTRLVTSTPPGIPLSPTPFQFIPPTNPPPPTVTPFIPTETMAPTLTTVPDSDGDGLNDLNDSCPAVPGPPENSGCPIPTATSTVTRTPLPPPSDTPTATATLTLTPTDTKVPPPPPEIGPPPEETQPAEPPGAESTEQSSP